MTLEEFLAEWNGDSPCVTVQTSGSTGLPKVMAVEKERMRASALMTCDFLHIQPQATALLCMDLRYIGAKMMVVRALTRQLRLLVVPPCGHPLASLPRKEDIQLAAMVPLQVYNSLQNNQETEILKSIDHLLVGGGGIDPSLERRLRTFPNAIWSTYGMTETLSHIALRRISGSQASDYYTPLSGVELSVDVNQCLCINAPALHPGILQTHDRVELLPDQRFRILGRSDNVVVSGGVKIQMEEVERLLAPVLSAPFLITRARDEKFGECVVLLSEDSNMAELPAVCRKVLPPYWVPRRFVHVDRIPMTENGKPARAEAELIVSEANN